MSDPYDDPEMKEFLENARKDLFPKMEESAMSITLLGSKPDPKLCMELGAAILFDKPIIVLALNQELLLPANLSRVAAAVVYGDPRDLKTQSDLRRAIDKVRASMGKSQ